MSSKDILVSEDEIVSGEETTEDNNKIKEYLYINVGITDDIWDLLTLKPNETTFTVQQLDESSESKIDFINPDLEECMYRFVNLDKYDYQSEFMNINFIISADDNNTHLELFPNAKLVFIKKFEHFPEDGYHRIMTDFTQKPMIIYCDLELARLFRANTLTTLDQQMIGYHMCGRFLWVYSGTETRSKVIQLATSEKAQLNLMLVGFENLRMYLSYNAFNKQSCMKQLYNNCISNAQRLLNDFNDHKSLDVSHIKQFRKYQKQMNKIKYQLDDNCESKNKSKFDHMNEIIDQYLNSIYELIEQKILFDVSEQTIIQCDWYCREIRHKFHEKYLSKIDTFFVIINKAIAHYLNQYQLESDVDKKYTLIHKLRYHFYTKWFDLLKECTCLQGIINQEPEDQLVAMKDLGTKFDLDIHKLADLGLHFLMNQTMPRPASARFWSNMITHQDHPFAIQLHNVRVAMTKKLENIDANISTKTDLDSYIYSMLRKIDEDDIFSYDDMCTKLSGRKIRDSKISVDYRARAEFSIDDIYMDLCPKYEMHDFEDDCNCDVLESNMYIAAKKGFMQVLQWAKINGVLNESAMSGAARKNKKDIIDWLEEEQCPWGETTTASAAKGGHFELLKWLKEDNCPIDYKTPAYAAKKGHLDILKWALDNGCKWDEMIATYAAKGGQIDILKWIEEQGFSMDENTLYYALVNGQFEVFKWAYENECPRPDDMHIIALRNDQFEILNWLLKQDDNGLPYDNIIQFTFHNNTIVKIYRNALIEWIVANDLASKKKICRLAIKHNCLNVIKYAYKEDYPITKKLYKYALKKNRKAIAKWMIDNKCFD